jgi:hypothetical protein
VAIGWGLVLVTLAACAAVTVVVGYAVALLVALLARVVWWLLELSRRPLHA